MRRVAVIAILLVSFAAAAILLRVSTRASAREWVATWSGATRPFVEQGISGSQAPPPEFRDACEHGVLQDQTIRIAVRSTVSGSRSRILLSNQYGKQPLTIGAATIAKIVTKRTGWRDPVFNWGYSPLPETEQQILFGGKPSVVIPPGGLVRSDPAALEASDRGYLQVSLYLPNKTDPATWVGGATASSVLLGDSTALNPQTSRGYSLRGGYWLAAVEVEAEANSKTILILDDDNTGRNWLPRGSGWPESFKDRLLGGGGSKRFAVVDSSLANCSTLGYCPVAVLDRIEDARRNRAGVKWVVLSTGFTDIQIATSLRGPIVRPTLTADDVIRSQKRIVDAVHAAGMRVYGVTYPPPDRTWEYTEDMEVLRVPVNRWIRESGAFDAVADFDRALRDPESPTQMSLVFKGGHESERSIHAFMAMANAFDVSAF